MKNQEWLILEPRSVNESARRRHRTASKAELFIVLEALLPFAEVEIDVLSDYVENFPDDPEHAEDAERARRGKQALEAAYSLIGRKSGYIRRVRRNSDVF